MRKIPLPHPFDEEPFTVADALAAGVARSRLRASDLSREFHGVRSNVAATTLVQRCRALATRLPPDAAFSHATAALLIGAPLPPELERDPTLHVTVPAPRRAPRGRHVVGHQSRSVRTWSVRGVRITVPEQTWCALAETLRLDDLVAVGDHLVDTTRPIVSQAMLRAEVTSSSGRGVRALRSALALIDGRAQSRPESRTRTICTVAGLGPCIPNPDIFDEHGRFVARTDLDLPRLMLYLEYQGDYHRDAAQWRRDMTRRARIEEVTGRRVMEINADDLRDPEELVRRVLALARATRPGIDLPRVANGWSRLLAVPGNSTRYRRGAPSADVR